MQRRGIPTSSFFNQAFYYQWALDQHMDIHAAAYRACQSSSGALCMFLIHILLFLLLLNLRYPQNQTNLVFSNSTIRQTVHVSVGAQQIRLRISNAFGTTNLPITAVTVALPANGAAGSSAIQPSTLQTVTFSNSASFTIPNGALAVSDPINFLVQPQSILTVSIYLAQGQQSNYITSHPGSRTTSWFSFGNNVNDTDITGSSRQSAVHWYVFLPLSWYQFLLMCGCCRYFLSAVEAWVSQSSSTFAIVGDSITDGRGSDTDKNNR